MATAGRAWLATAPLGCSRAAPELLLGAPGSSWPLLAMATPWLLLGWSWLLLGCFFWLTFGFPYLRLVKPNCSWLLLARSLDAPGCPWSTPGCSWRLLAAMAAPSCTWLSLVALLAPRGCSWLLLAAWLLRDCSWLLLGCFWAAPCCPWLPFARRGCSWPFAIGPGCSLAAWLPLGCCWLLLGCSWMLLDYPWLLVGRAWLPLLAPDNNPGYSWTATSCASRALGCAWSALGGSWPGWVTHALLLANITLISILFTLLTNNQHNDHEIVHAPKQ